MGAWSHTSFGNDTACDFLYDVGKNTRAIERAIKAIEKIAVGDYIESEPATNVVAAGELLAAANGKPPQDYPEEAQAIVSKLKPDAKLRSRAALAITRILEASELRELWEESDYFNDWSTDVTELIARLR
jgi:Domain of unknown function (DUF4259)